MKCSKCKFYIISKMQGNHCGCMGNKPCDKRRKEKDNLRRKRKYSNYETDRK